MKKIYFINFIEVNKSIFKEFFFILLNKNISIVYNRITYLN